MRCRQVVELLYREGRIVVAIGPWPINTAKAAGSRVRPVRPAVTKIM
jgi:hypothetical protein